jgi:lipopolysaccharide/colanic/teichoic acid biosynthesis glycosyltransferase
MQNHAESKHILIGNSIHDRIRWIEKYDPDEALLRGKAYLVAKHIFDFSVIILSLPFLIPLFIVLMLLVKHEYPERKIFYKQLRTGKNGKRFWMFKFSTMVPNADELKTSLQPLSIVKYPDFKLVNDPRVTRLGKFLRKTSLDEFPQLFNVIRGEMSLVGPRPTSFGPEVYKIWHTERLEVIPGMTGLWQITTRNKTEFDERLITDIAYIQHRCFMLDLEILLRTLLDVFKGKGV